VVREIIRAVTNIQNVTLEEYKVRDLNDRINKLFKEKQHWERRIKELGGTDHLVTYLNLSDKAIINQGYM